MWMHMYRVFLCMNGLFCLFRSANGSINAIVGSAKATDPTVPAKLEVSFFEGKDITQSHAHTHAHTQTRTHSQKHKHKLKHQPTRTDSCPIPSLFSFSNPSSNIFCLNITINTQNIPIHIVEINGTKAYIFLANVVHTTIYPPLRQCCLG